MAHDTHADLNLWAKEDLLKLREELQADLRVFRPSLDTRGIEGDPTPTQRLGDARSAISELLRAVDRVLASR